MKAAITVPWTLPDRIVVHWPNGTEASLSREEYGQVCLRSATPFMAADTLSFIADLRNLMVPQPAQEEPGELPW